MKRRGWDKKRTYNEYTLFPITVNTLFPITVNTHFPITVNTHFPNIVNTLFQVRLSQIVIPDLIRRHPELDSGQNEYTLIQVRLSQIVIPDLIREPVVFRHVGGLRVYSSGSRVKHGMTISECLT